MLGAEPKRTAKVQHKLPEPLDKRLVLDASEQPAHGISIADHTRFNTLSEPRATGYATSPPAAVDAVFAGYVLRFVVVRCFHPPNEKSRESPACGVVFN